MMKRIGDATRQQAAHERRGASDCGEHRQVAGAVAALNELRSLITETIGPWLPMRSPYERTWG
jgi:hypothetical protein